MTNANQFQGDQDVSAAAAGRLPTQLLDTLERAESFISGFEDDEDQEGVAELLSSLRSLLADFRIA